MSPWFYLVLAILGMGLFYFGNENLVLSRKPLSAPSTPQNLGEYFLLECNFFGLFLTLLGLMGAYNKVHSQLITSFPSHLIKMWIGLHGQRETSVISLHTAKQILRNLGRLKNQMGVKPSDIIYAGIGFLLVGILTPIGLGAIFTTSFGGNTTNINTAVLTIFQVLLPILYVIGAGLYFIPKVGK